MSFGLRALRHAGGAHPSAPMQILSFRDSKYPLFQVIRLARKVLKQGGVIAHPTDTCYGFATLVTSKKALSRLYRLKHMPKTKPVSILVSSLKEAKKYGVWNSTAAKLAKKFWPGALTLVLKRTKYLPRWVNTQHTTVGIRFPADKISQKLAKDLGPLTTTSANVSGQKAPYTIEEILRQFKRRKQKPDFILDGGKLFSKNLPSTVMDVTKYPPKILRQGGVTLFE